MDADYFRLLYAYNAWANGAVLDAARGVSEADYFAPRPGLSFENLHGSLVHVMSAEAVWLGRWVGQPVSGVLADARRTDLIVASEVPTFAVLQGLWRDLGERLLAFIEALTDEDVSRSITHTVTDGTTYTQPLGHQLAHLVNHGTQFRAEAAVALTAMNHSPGELDLIFYLRRRPST
jgi:uncharacterized damage-inducible protein DinB